MKPQPYDAKNLPTTYADLMDVMEAINVEIEDITCQLADYDNAPEEDLDEDRHQWAIRAEDARMHRYKLKAKVKKLANMAWREENAVRIEAQSRRNAERQAERDRLERERLALKARLVAEANAAKQAAKERNIAASVANAAAVKSEILRHLRTHHPAVYAEVVAMLQSQRQQEEAA